MGPQNLKSVSWCNHVYFRDGLSSIGLEFIQSACVPNLKSLCSPTTKYEKQCDMKKSGCFCFWGGGLGVTQNHGQHNHSIEHIWLAYMTKFLFNFIINLYLWNVTRALWLIVNNSVKFTQRQVSVVGINEWINELIYCPIIHGIITPTHFKIGKR